MSILSKIIEAVNELELYGSKKEDIIIAYSQLFENILFKGRLEYREVYHAGYVNDPTIEKLYGVKTYNLYPYNEILVYDSKNAPLFPELIKKIPYISYP